MKNCPCHTETITDGSGQLQRYLKALDPSYAPIDGRSIEDLLVFAKKYAELIRFYDVPESKIEGDDTDPKKLSWSEFFRRDMAVIIASIAVTDIAVYKQAYDQANTNLQRQPDLDFYAALFVPIIDMLKKIDGWYTVAIPQNPLYNDLVLAIQSNLKQQTKKILAYEQGLKYVDPKFNLHIDLKDIENDDVWGINEPIDPDATIYEGVTDEDKILNASLFVDDIFQAFFGFLTQLQANADKYMQFALEAYPGHQPHMALFITFLQLFRKAQDQMNGLTGSMLNFYYKDILHIDAKPSVADKVFIVFELAKDVTEYDIAPGTALKAGKDASGKEQLYTTTGDLVVNQAKVKSVKTIFVEKTNLEAAETRQVVHAVYARPVANSADGKGAPFEDPQPKWPTFGAGDAQNLAPQNICETIDILKELSDRNDEAKVGFAIASPQILMQGGKRLVEFTLNNADAFFSMLEKLQASGGSLFEVWFTAEKEWLKVDRLFTAAEKASFVMLLDFGMFNPKFVDTEPGYYFDKDKRTISIYLPASAPAIIGYKAKEHAAFSYDTTQPVMQVLLNNIIDLTATEYQGLSINNFSLTVKVGSIFPTFTEATQGASDPKSIEFFKRVKELGLTLSNLLVTDGLTKLVLENETGIVTAGKPFDPFTPYPAKGKSFYIGSDEVFNKTVAELSVTINKTDTSSKSGLQDFASLTPQSNVFANNPEASNADATTPNIFDLSIDYSLEIREKRNWKTLVTSASKNFSVATLLFNVLNLPGKVTPNGVPEGIVPFVHPRLPILPVSKYTIDTEKGFLQVTNILTTEDDFQSRQNRAAAMEIKEVALNYVSVLNPLESGIDSFYHVYPFGNVPIYMIPTVVDNNTTKPIMALSNEIKTPSSTIQKIADYSKINFSKYKAGEGLVKRIGIVQTDKLNFTSLDVASNLLLVDAGNRLLPQFTYLWPYAQYNAATVKPTSAVKTSELKKPGAKSATSEATVNTLMLEASGLLRSVSGGANQYSAFVQEEGMLFIGLEKAVPLQMISMLFQFAEGSAMDEDSDPPTINWSYLTNNEWRPLQQESIIADGTFGFQTTGIVKIELPQDASTNNTIITSGLHWFCASVTNNSNRIPMLIDVVTQAVPAAFQDDNNDASHFDKALAAGSISKLSVAASQIGKVSQPFASFDGKHKEIGKELYTRASERLRHKARAITAWDYEHLVLDRFPSIYKVKCITHTDPNCLCREPNEYTNARLKATCCGPQIAPGHVLLVPIANLKNRNAVNPLQPKTARRTMLEIEAYLKARTSPFVHVHARNPVYEQVLVFFRVQFYKGNEKGYYMKKLNEEIVHFLTPWAFDENVDVKFGQKIYASSIINFIEERPYVDFITDFLMVVCGHNCCPDTAAIRTEVERQDETATDVFSKICGCNDMEILLADSDFAGEIVAKPSTPRSILVSVPQHIIVPYQAPPRISPCEAKKKEVPPTRITGGTTRPMAVDTSKSTLPTGDDARPAVEKNVNNPEEKASATPLTAPAIPPAEKTTGTPAAIKTPSKKSAKNKNQAKTEGKNDPQ